MATQRYISTSFWDDRWIRSLNPADRYLYLYLMTNPLTNIAGVYAITVDRIAFDTGYDERTLRPMLDRFDQAGKALHFKDEWMILPAWPRHQKWESRAKIRDGIISVLQDAPRELLEYLAEVDYQFDLMLVDSTIIASKVREGVSGSTRKRVIDEANGVCSRCGGTSNHLEISHITPVKDGGDNSEGNLQAVCKPCLREILSPYTIYGHETQSIPVHNYSDSDSDLDLDTDTDLSMRADARAQGDDQHPPVPAEAKKPRPLAPLTDPVAAQWEQALTQMQPPDTWPNVAKERKHCQTLGQKTANLLGNSPYHEPADLIAAVLREYHRMKSKAKASDTYWRHAPFTPSAVLTRWADIWASMATRFEQDTRQARIQESLQEVVF